VDVALNLREEALVPLGEEQMPKAALRLEVFFDRFESTRNQRMTDVTVDRLLQRPDARLDGQFCQLIAQLRVESPTGRADRQREKELRPAPLHRPIDLISKVDRFVRGNGCDIRRL